MSQDSAKRTLERLGAGAVVVEVIVERPSSAVSFRNDQPTGRQATQARSALCTAWACSHIGSISPHTPRP